MKLLGITGNVRGFTLELQDYDDAVCLYAVSDQLEQIVPLLFFNKDNPVSVTRARGVDAELGLKLDKQKRIIIK